MPTSKQQPHWFVSVAATAAIGLVTWYGQTLWTARTTRLGKAQAFYSVVRKMQDDAMLNDADPSALTSFAEDATDFKSLLRNDDYKDYLGIDDLIPHSNLDLLLTSLDQQSSGFLLDYGRAKSARGTNEEAGAVRRASDHLDDLRPAIDALLSGLYRAGYH